MSTKQDLAVALATLNEAQATAFRLRDELFPVGAKVHSEDGTGEGVVARDWQCPAHKVPVRFANGNVWFKHVEDWRTA